MKSTGRIIAVMFLLFLAGNCSLNAQKWGGDTTGTGNQWKRHMEMSDMRHMRSMSHRTDSMRMGEMRHHPGSMHMWGMNPYMYGWQMVPFGRFGFRPPIYGMRHMGPMDQDYFGWHHPGGDRPWIADIPNLTDKQKKEIADLRQKHRDEMISFRDEFKAKFQDMRESHRKEIMSLLTDEQKKFLEPGKDNINKGSSKEK